MIPQILHCGTVSISKNRESQASLTDFLQQKNNTEQKCKVAKQYSYHRLFILPIHDWPHFTFPKEDYDLFLLRQPHPHL